MSQGNKVNADQTKVSKIMTTNVVCVTAELPVEALIEEMLDRGFSGAPVVDEDARAIGVVSKTDVLRERDRAPGTLVRDIMMPVAFTLPERATIAEAAALMAFEGMHRIPITGKDGRIVGILSAMDVLAWVADEEGVLRGGATKS